LALAVSHGLDVSLVHGFDVVILVVPVLTSLAALSAMPALARPWRIVSGLLVGFCYLAAAYTVQAAFKEVIEGMLVVAFALAVRDLASGPRAPRPWHGIPLGFLLAGAVYAYSYPGGRSGCSARRCPPRWPPCWPARRSAPRRSAA
jgi:hypothetical protein